MSIVEIVRFLSFFPCSQNVDKHVDNVENSPIDNQESKRLPSCETSPAPMVMHKSLRKEFF